MHLVRRRSLISQSWRNIARLVVFILGLSSYAVACGFDANESAGPNRLVEWNAPLNIRDQLAPWTERYLVFVGAQRVTAACMEGRGFSYQQPGNSYRAATEWDRLGEQFTFGVSAAYPNQIFGITEGFRMYAEMSKDPNAENFSDESWAAALLGQGDAIATLSDGSGGSISMNTDGCMAVGWTAMFSTLEDYLAWSFPAQFEDAVIRRIYQIESISQLIVKWRECVRNEGYDFRYPAELAGSVANDLVGGESSVDRAMKSEVELVTLAKLCDPRSELFRSSWAAADAAIADELVSQAAKVERYRSAVRRASQ